MNYLEELKALYHYSIAHTLSPEEISLLRALYGIHQVSDGSEWFYAKDALLSSLTGGLAREVVEKAQKALEEQGRIVVKESQNNKKKYKINPFCSPQKNQRCQITIQQTETWKEYLLSQKRQGSPLDSWEKERTLKRLMELTKGDLLLQEKILNQSIHRGWKGVFPLTPLEKPGSSSSSVSPFRPGALWESQGTPSYDLQRMEEITTKGSVWD